MTPRRVSPSSREGLRLLRLGLWFFLWVLLLAGCGRWSIKDRVAPPPNVCEIEGIRRVGIDPPQAYTYRIGVGDILGIRFFYYPDMLDPSINVPSDGVVQLPLLGPVQVLGYTETELNTLLNEKYSQRLMFPDLIVRIGTRKHDGVYLDGASGNVGTLPYDSQLTLVDSLKRTYMGAGAGSMRSVIVIRGLNSPQYVSFSINVNKILDGKEHDIYLEPNDIVYIPKKFILDVNYFTEKYIDGVLGRHIAPAQVFPQAFPYKADITQSFAIDFLDVE